MGVPDLTTRSRCGATGCRAIERESAPRVSFPPTSLAADMLNWQESGGFSIDASVRIEGEDRAGVERLVRYCARPPLALERLHAPSGLASLGSPEAKLIYRLPEPDLDGRTALGRARGLGTGRPLTSPARAAARPASGRRPLPRDLGAPSRPHLRGAASAVPRVWRRDEDHRVPH
jgi:hypothetical protein